MPRRRRATSARRRTGPASRRGTARAATRRSEPVHQPRAVLARLRGRVLFEARDPRNAAARPGQLPDDLREHARRVLPDPGRPACASSSTPARPRRRRTAGPPASSSSRPASASWSSSPDQAPTWADVRRTLAAEGIEIVKYGAIPEHHDTLRQRFIDEIYPVLTPLAVDPGHPFPYISTLSLSIAVGLRDPETDERRFARVKVPQILPRLYQVEPNRFVLLDQIIEANLDLLFSGMEIVEHHLFRVTRNADLAIEEDEADDLLLAIEEELRRRRFGEAVRLEVERSMPGGDAGDPPARARPRRGRRLRGPRACST